MSEDASADRSSKLDRVPPTEATRQEERLSVEDADYPSQEEQAGNGASNGGNGSDPDLVLASESPKRRVLLDHVTHEIRTPLTAMTGIASVLLEGDLDPEQRKSVETIRDSGEYVLSLVDDILDLSKAASGELTLDEERVDLEETIQSSFDMVAHRADMKGLELSLALGDGVPREILTDGNHLKQVIVNLLANAVKFTDDGGVGVTVERAGYALDEDGARVLLLFTIQDTGSGIPEDSLDGVFQPFSQVNGSDGSGLGLTICRELVSLMGGSIGVQSTVGKGSTFQFTIRSQPAFEGVPA